MTFSTISPEEQKVIDLALSILAQHMQDNEVLTSPADARRYCQLQLGALEHEVFAIMFLDNKHRLIRFDPMFRGTIDHACVFPREIAKAALYCNAAAVICTHNHPSADCEPSPADIRITERIQQALELLDVRVLDHVIVSHIGTCSFAERGLL